MLLFPLGECTMNCVCEKRQTFVNEKDKEYQHNYGDV